MIKHKSVTAGTKSKQVLRKISELPPESILKAVWWGGVLKLERFHLWIAPKEYSFQQH